MGNQVGVCREPPQLSELFPLPNEEQYANVNGGDHSMHDDGFRSYIQMWRFYSENGDDVYVKNSPVKLGLFRKFDSRDCYIALHIFKNYHDESKTQASPAEVPASGTSLRDLVMSSVDELTPRGISSSFGTLSLEPFIHTSREDFTHDLYVWNGKASSPLAKAVALAKGFEIERVLVKEKITGTVYRRFARSPKSSLASLFRDDIDDGTGKTSPSDTRRYEFNHLFRQLLSPNRKSYIKIGELFGNHPVDSPRFEVLRQLKFPPSTVSSTTRHDPSNRKPKVPSLSLNALPPYITSQQQQDDDATPRPKVPPIFIKDAADGDYSTWEPSKVLTVFQPILSKILDFLFLSSRIPTADKPLLKQHGITHILNCAGAVCQNHFPEDFTYKTFFITDGVNEDIDCLFYEALDFIEEARMNGGKVLIHCHQGVSRSSSFVILYLMWRFRWPFTMAHEHVKSIRFISNPNSGFTYQLMIWYKMMLGLSPAEFAPPPPPVALPVQTPNTPTLSNSSRSLPTTPRNITALRGESYAGSPRGPRSSPSPSPPIDAPLATPRGAPPPREIVQPSSIPIPNDTSSQNPSSLIPSPSPPPSATSLIPSASPPTTSPTPTTPRDQSITEPSSSLSRSNASVTRPRTPSTPPAITRAPGTPPLSARAPATPPRTPRSPSRSPSPSPSPAPSPIPRTTAILPGCKLYRLVPHSQGTIVVPKRVPEPTYRCLDPRGCFILSTPARVFMWIGTRCPAVLVEGGRKAIDRLQRYELAASDVTEIHQSAEPNQFWDCVPGGAGEVIDNSSYREYASPGGVSPPRAAELAPQFGGVGEREEAVFYQFVDPEWNKIDAFDVDDLDASGIFVLYVPPNLWVWIGKDYIGKEGILAGDVDGLLVARKFSDDLKFPIEGIAVTIIKYVEQESDEFLSHFH